MIKQSETGSGHELTTDEERLAILKRVRTGPAPEAITRCSVESEGSSAAMPPARLVHCHFCGAPRIPSDPVCTQCGHEVRSYRTVRRLFIVAVPGMFMTIILLIGATILAELSNNNFVTGALFFAVPLLISAFVWWAILAGPRTEDD